MIYTLKKILQKSKVITWKGINRLIGKEPSSTKISQLDILGENIITDPNDVIMDLTLTFLKYDLYYPQQLKRQLANSLII